MLRIRARRAALLVIAALSGVASTVAASTPAFADLPSGVGYSASWDYYTSTSYRYTATLPGIRLTGYGTDSNGTRTTLGTISDIAADSRCGRVVLYGGSTLLADKTVCGNGTSVSYSTASFSGVLSIVFHRIVSGTTTVDHSYTFAVPSSVNDPQLRTVGTGASWTYTDDHSFEFALHRPTVSLTGNGAHQPWQNQRSVLADLEPGAFRCATGRVQSTNLTVTGGDCNGDITFIDDWFFSGWVLLEACDTGSMFTNVENPVPALPRCVSIQVPTPR
ncbi:hypothetical protein F4553_000798 [Allocatelliglobosispora scoriae]|uniref:Uncharacterized protein n=1 Tax=Allocatelliglobosispora scoriae TaxID=643052 RepID=A0A841BJT0_9ACTN|nr:hypothetical protein [Allocatelliglobosispora scoriae]MBB5867419.1 hypothetical protein [Allocatelliglobosispora scoriae]